MVNYFKILVGNVEGKRAFGIGKSKCESFIKIRITVVGTSNAVRNGYEIKVVELRTCARFVFSVNGFRVVNIVVHKTNAETNCRTLYKFLDFMTS